MTEKVTKLAFASRIIVLVLQLLANSALPDHRPDVFRAVGALAPANVTESYTNDGVIFTTAPEPPSLTKETWLDRTLHFCLGGLRHWDAEYFLHIAEHTYSYENTLAFYPLYPLLVRTAAQTLHWFGLGLSLRSWTLLVAVLLNLACFCQAANVMYALTQRIFGDLNKSWNASLLFCINPASIFFSAAYSETLFALLSLQLMYECVTELRLLHCTATLALSIVTRANGLVNAGFPVYFLLRKFILKPLNRGWLLVQLVLCLLGSLIPLTFFYFYAFQQFCQPDRGVDHSPAVIAYARERNYILAGHRQPLNSPWCDQSPFPFPYSYIQSHYWNVGFLRYYELKQVPNFVLALPVLGFLAYHCCTYLQHFARALLLPQYTLVQLLKEYKSFPFVLHAFFLTMFCALFVHIQISTRLLCSATPCIYWFAADHMPKTLDQISWRSNAGAILIWFCGYFVLGTVLFSNNLPWT